MPEGRGDEYSHVVHESWFLALCECSVVHVMLQPEMNHVVPVLHHNLCRETELDLVNVDTVDMIKAVFSSLLVLSCIAET